MTRNNTQHAQNECNPARHDLSHALPGHVLLDAREWTRQIGGTGTDDEMSTWT